MSCPQNSILWDQKGKTALGPACSLYEPYMDFLWASPFLGAHGTSLGPLWTSLHWLHMGFCGHVDCGPKGQGHPTWAPSGLTAVVLFIKSIQAEGAKKELGGWDGTIIFLM